MEVWLLWSMLSRISQYHLSYIEVEHRVGTQTSAKIGVDSYCYLFVNECYAF